MEQWLIESGKRGSTQALGALFDVNVVPVYRYALASLGSRTAAEQATDRVFRHVRGRLGEYQPRSMPFLAWLMSIARTEIREERSRTQENSGAKLDLRGLSDHQADVLLLRFVAGLSVVETAAAMGMKESSVKALQHAAIAALPGPSTRNRGAAGGDSEGPPRVGVVARSPSRLEA